MSDVEMSAIIRRLQSDGMTDEERALKRLTRRNRMKLSNWSAWDEGFDMQLDAHWEAGALGEPVPRPGPAADGRHPNILRMHWTNVVKPDGRRKCQACIDSSKRAAPWLREFAKTYASCIEQPCMRLFFALAAAKGLTVSIADTRQSAMGAAGAPRETTVAGTRTRTRSRVTAEAAEVEAAVEEAAGAMEGLGVRSARRETWGWKNSSDFLLR